MDTSYARRLVAEVAAHRAALYEAEDALAEGAGENEAFERAVDAARNTRERVTEKLEAMVPGEKPVAFKGRVKRGSTG